MDISYTYLYQLVDEKTNKIFYVGKSNNPQNRFSGHRNIGNFVGRKFYMEIIDKYIDKEDEMINKLINEGYELLNVRKNDYILKEHNIGDKIIHDPMIRINKLFNK